MSTTKKVNLGSVPHHANEIHKIPLPEGVPQPPMLAMFVARRGQGKSTAAARLLKFYADHKPAIFQKDFIFVVSPTAESQKHLWNHIGIPDHNVFDVDNAPQIKKIIDTIVDVLAEAKHQYDEDQEYLVAYKKLCNDEELTTRERALLESRDATELKNPMEWPRPVLILDDLSHMKVLDQKWFTSLCLRHRHVAGGIGLSMIIIAQSLRGGIARPVRQNCSLICLWMTQDKNAKKDLGEECSHYLEYDEFEAVFDDATDDFHSFLAVDLTQKNPNLVFSKNLEHWYQIRHDKKLSDQSQSTHEQKKPCHPPPDPKLPRVANVPPKERIM